ncbi:hypothetical protein EV121DRAFT_271844 [Schizophyllum commune]
MSHLTIYFVTGANRGIGLSIVTALSARHDAVVFTGARDPSRANDLSALARAHPDRVHVIKVVSADKENNEAAIEEVKRVTGRLDVRFYEPALEVPTEGMNRHFEVNTNGPLVLFQAANPLLRGSTNPKFVTISSGLGSIALAGELSVNMYAYGASKAAANWVMRKLHHDFPDMVIFPISPGMVATDMAKDGRGRDPGMIDLQKALPPITPTESARGILEQVDVSTRETHGGYLVDYSGLGKWGW